MKLLEGQVRIPSGCAVSAVISREGRRMSGQAIIDSMKPMHDRSNGLGGGFAGYGIYPEFRDYFAFHLFFQDHSTRRTCEAFLKERFDIVLAEEIPVKKMPQIDVYKRQSLPGRSMRNPHDAGPPPQTNKRHAAGHTCPPGLPQQCGRDS